MRLWKPSSKIINNSNLFKFEKFIAKKFNKKFNVNFNKIHDWSVKNQGDFWSSVWDFSKIKGTKGNTKVKKSKKFYKNIYLQNSKEKAITFISENGYREIRKWNELNKNVKNLSNNLKKLNIKSKDRIAAYMPNIPETVEAFLGSVAIGATWSSCSPDFGINGVIERFSQIKPKILIVTNQYFYNGKKINILDRIP